MLIDSHTHVDRYELINERSLDSAVEEIARNRIFTISNAMDPDSYRKNAEISRSCGWIVPAFGVHPWNAPRFDGSLADLSSYLEQAPLLGEIGLDYFFVEDSSAYPAQRKVFEFFLAEARKCDKIVILHTKGAEREALHSLERFGNPRVIVHWYSGPMDVFRELAGRGVYFTVGAEVLHSANIRRIAREIPEERLLSETDNPGGPQALFGKPGFPALIQDIVHAIADVRGKSSEEIETAIQRNMSVLFGKDPGLTSVFQKAVAKSGTVNR